MVSRILSTLLCAAILAVGICAYGGALKPFIAKELGLQQASPQEADFERPFDLPLPARLSSQGGKRETVQLTNCRDYLALRDRIVGSDNDADYRVLRYQGVTCETLAVIQNTLPAKRSALPADFATLTETKFYPAALWPAVSDEELISLTRAGATLKTASGKARFRVTPEGGLELLAKGMGLRLILLARGDFNNDGWEDALFRWEGYSLQGTYADSRLVLLTGTGRTLRQLNVETLLRH